MSTPPIPYIESVVLRHWSDGKEIKDKFKVLSLPEAAPAAIAVEGYSTDEASVNTSLDIKSSKAHRHESWTARLFDLCFPASALVLKLISFEMVIGF